MTSDLRYAFRSLSRQRATAFLVIMAMTLGLILPRMLFERFLPAPT